MSDLSNPGGRAAGAVHLRREVLATSTDDRGRLNGTEIARLVRSASAGDDSAWDALVEQFSGLIWAVARGHRLGHADAADVVQVTWLRLMQHVHSLNEPACVGAWLATTARRECLHMLRDSRRVVPLSDTDAGHESSDVPADEALLLAERDEMLWRAFAQLRPSDQALLRLLMAEPRPSYEEISAALSMPIGSIGPTRARALERLHRKLEQEGRLALLSAA